MSGSLLLAVWAIAPQLAMANPMQTARAPQTSASAGPSATQDIPSKSIDGPPLPTPTARPVAPVAPSTATAPATGQRLNPTGRDISLTVPLTTGDTQLGDVAFVLGSDDSIRLNSITLIEAMRRVLSPTALAELQSRLATIGFVSTDQLRTFGYSVNYDPESIALRLDLPVSARSVERLALVHQGTRAVGEFNPPANFTGYINFRNFVSYNWSAKSDRLQSPTSFIDSAIRVKGVVLENEALLAADADQVFRRSGTRLVYDDRQRLIRATAGDLQPLSRGFSGAPDMAGIGISRLYSQLDPLLLIQPRGNRSFTLSRPSTVDALVNGQSIRQFRLQPGTYNLGDFPFAQGTNALSLQIRDDSGLTQTLNFSLFFDRSLLAPGRMEFGLYAGVLAPPTQASRDYRINEPVATGFIRRGITDTFTAGANFHIQKEGGVGGVEGVWATSIGTLGLDAAVSSVRRIGSGFAINASYLATIRPTGTSAGFAVQYISVNFADPNDLFPYNRFSFDLSATLGQRLFRSQSISLTARYALGRNGYPNETDVRLDYGWQFNPRLYLTAEAQYQDGIFARHEVAARVRLTFRLGRRSSVYSEYDSFDNRAQVGFETTRGDGVGSIAAAVDASVGRDGKGLDGNVTYIGNRAEVGLDHATLFDLAGNGIDSQRTTLRFSTALVFADGHLAVSRPIYDSFVMATTHSTLRGAPIYLDPTQRGYEAKSGFFGPAVEPTVTSYIPRVITYDVPGAPAGYDIGEGNIRILPPYRSGYLITAGSDYSITGVGTLLNDQGQPIPLLAGRVVELARPDRPGITVFTNQVGRFGISGLRPGRWRIEMPTQPPTSVVIDVPSSASGLLQLGDVKLGDAR